MKKNRKKTILILCAGGSGPIFLARVLAKKYNVVLADGSGDNAAPFLGFKFYVVPFGNHPEYLTVIKKIIQKHKVDYVVSGADEELIPISILAQDMGSFVHIAPSLDFIKLCLNKKQLMIELEQASISNLSLFKKIQDVKYPAIVKPIYGRGSRGVHIVNNTAELKGYFGLYSKKFSDVVVQKHISGVEYTVSVIVNNMNAMIGIVPKKVIYKRGITRAAVTEDNPSIEKICRKIVELWQPRGPFNVQLMLYKNKVYIFEINPRLSTTSVLTDRAFGNEVELFIKYYNKTSINKPPTLKVPVFLYRYEENIFK